MSKDYDIVIYHKGCFDGFASAYIAQKKLKKKAKYIPLSYKDNVPNLKDKSILICDFSFDEKTMKKLIKLNKKVYVIDHHVTAEANLKNLDDKYKLFDMNHSGAYLVWKYFYPKKDIPSFVKLVEDYDLWKFKYDFTKAFILGLGLFQYKFDQWAKLEDEEYVKKIIKKGNYLLLHQANAIKKECKKFKIKEETIDGKQYRVCYKNTTTLINEFGNHLVTNNKCDFAVCYFYNDNDDTTKFSLRSIDSKTDVSEIAKKLGGGGHRNASALTRKGLHNSIV